MFLVKGREQEPAGEELMGSATSPTAGQGGNPGRTSDNRGEWFWPSYARLEKREISLEAITEPMPISPNSGNSPAVSAIFTGAGRSCTGIGAATGVIAWGSGAGCTGGSLLATKNSMGFSSPFSSTN